MNGITDWLTAAAATVAILSGLVVLFRELRRAFRRNVIDTVEDWQAQMLDSGRRDPYGEDIT